MNSANDRIRSFQSSENQLLKKIEASAAQKQSLEISLKKKEEEYRSLQAKLDNESKTSIKQRDDSEKKITELEQAIADLKRTSFVSEKESADYDLDSESSQVKDSKSSFIIDIYPDQSGYRGIIRHRTTPGKEGRKAFKTLDEIPIKQFISEHLPQSLDNGIVSISPENKNNIHSPMMESSALSDLCEEGESLSFIFPNNAISSMYISQENVSISQRALQAGKPFSVKVECSLPTLTNHQASYHQQLSIQLILKEQMTSNRFYDSFQMPKIEMNKYEYQSNFSIDPLPTGSYILEVYLHVPSCQISDYRRILVNVSA